MTESMVPQVEVAGLSRYRWQDHSVCDIARFYFDKLGIPFLVSVGKFEDYDIISLDQKTVIEVKSETTTYRTGKVCIEYWNTDFDKPSGILSTKANLWVHVVYAGSGKFMAYEWDVPKLHKLVIETTEMVKGGRNSLCKLIPVDVFKAGAKARFEVRGVNFSSLARKEE
jgi:hypothetical protein